MRRGRRIREFRQHELRRRVKSLSDRRRDATERAARSRPKLSATEVKAKRLNRRRQILSANVYPVEGKTVPPPAGSPIIMPCKVPGRLLDYNSYTPDTSKTARILHVIDSLGLGGAQTMMMELIRALRKYFPHYTNDCVGVTRYKYNETFFNSYGVRPIVVWSNDFSSWLHKHHYDIVVHHRVSSSQSLHEVLPKKTYYILVNHTWHQLNRMREFMSCDLYVSVCKFLHERTRWHSSIHSSRRIVILNGVENDYLADIAPATLEGDFKSGRCHRMVNGKFRHESLRWMSSQVSKVIPGHHHYLIGSSRNAREISKREHTMHYMGTIFDREKKMSLIKSLDVYFYETFQDEGASIAILESLAAGVPVLCHPVGGNTELIKSTVNGFICLNRDDFLDRMVSLANDRDYLQSLKESVCRDFEKRLHVKHTAAKYMQLFESLL